MKIYGIYDMKEKEACMRVGTLKEITTFLEITGRELSRAINKNNLVKSKYKVCYIYNE